MRSGVSLDSWSWTVLAASFGRFDADLAGVSPAELRDACALLAARYGRAAKGAADEAGHRAHGRHRRRAAQQ